ncbi:MAG TPA: hypothetical protein DEZ27_07215, partial [Sphaerochaeta sp.]|nr:hypothetical protein [Sphaerochaeta sp.]
LNKVTAILGASFLVLAILLAVINKSPSTDSLRKRVHYCVLVDSRTQSTFVSSGLVLRSFSFPNGASGKEPC